MSDFEPRDRFELEWLRLKVLLLRLPAASAVAADLDGFEDFLAAARQSTP